MIWNFLSKTRTNIPAGFRLVQEGKREILVRNGHEDHLRQEGLLDPEILWAKTLPPAQMMGRGKLHLFKGRDEVVIRKYQHGGVLRRLTGDIFMFGFRPFQEVEVTEMVKSAGIPTLEILAAIRKREWGVWYRCYLVTRYLPEAVDLIHYLAQQPESKTRQDVIQKAGKVVRTMHRHGIYHADLHLKNFLVDAGKEPKVYLIDFDQSEICPHLRPSQRMKNLKRLDRSAEKLRATGLPLTPRDKGIFCSAYARGDREIRFFVRAYLKKYARYMLLYRWGWSIASFLYPSSSRSYRGPSQFH